jgi:hypothetical protein
MSTASRFNCRTVRALHRLLAPALLSTSAAIAIGAGLAAVVEPVPARPRAADERRSVPELGAVFWHCDRLASVSLVDPATAALCSQFTEELRVVKFGGDFDSMLGWWRQRKAHDLREAVAPAPDASTLEARVRDMNSGTGS